MTKNQKIIFKKYFKLSVKVGIALIIFVYLTKKIEWITLKEAFVYSSWYYVIPATLFFTLSKIISSFRLKKFLNVAGIPISETQNLRLYWLGMFYNLFLPGGIGGDAYKAWTFKKQFQTPLKLTFAPLMLDRLSGVYSLSIITIGLLFLSNQPDLPLSKFFRFIWVFIPLSLFGLMIFFKFFNLQKYQLTFFKTLCYSTFVQLSQILCVIFLLWNFEAEMYWVEYILLFLVSSIVAIIPLTPGGLGMREFVFLNGSIYFGINCSIAVGIAFLFFLISAFVSSFGLIYHLNPSRLRQGNLSLPIDTRSSA